MRDISELEQLKDLILIRLQSEALDKALEGHSLLILGQSGTGKSFILKVSVKILFKIGKSVKKTASTGIASLNIDGYGYGDGRYSSRVSQKKKIGINEYFAKF